MDLLPWPHSARCISIELTKLASKLMSPHANHIPLNALLTGSHTNVCIQCSELIHECENTTFTVFKFLHCEKWLLNILKACKNVSSYEIVVIFFSVMLSKKYTFYWQTHALDWAQIETFLKCCSNEELLKWAIICFKEFSFCCAQVVIKLLLVCVCTGANDFW